MNKQNLILGVLAFLMVALLWQSWTAGPITKVSAAPALAVLTPVANNGAANGSRNVDFFTGALTADSTKCFDLSGYRAMDIQWQVDEATPNAVTLTMRRFSIASAATPIAGYEDGPQLVATQTADAHGDAQVALFDRYTCLTADLDTAASVIVRASGNAH